MNKNVLSIARQGVFVGKNSCYKVCDAFPRRNVRMTKDMTQGSPLKLILAFAVPLMLGSLFQQFYNLADTPSLSAALLAWKRWRRWAAWAA